MPSASVILIAAAAAGLWLGGKATVHGAKKVVHKIEHVFKHKDKP